MGYLKRLTPQQLTTAACGAVVTASIMLSHGNELGFLLLALATVCGIGAFAKSRDAQAVPPGRRFAIEPGGHAYGDTPQPCGRHGMQNSALNALLDAIEAELRRLGYLGDAGPITGVPSAFGHGRMAFEQWLGQVFLPNARAAVAASDLPESSQVAVAAARNLDGGEETETLLGLLSSFDAEINQAGRAAIGIPQRA